MKFNRADLLETVEMLNSGLGVGMSQVYFSEHSGLYKAADFELVREVEIEFLGKEHFAGRVSLDASDFFESLMRISFRRDLGEVIDVAVVEARMEKEILQVFSELKGIGLYEPFLEKQIRDLVRFGEGPERPVFREFGEGKVGFLVNVDYKGATRLSGFALMVPITPMVHELLYFPKEVSVELVGSMIRDVESLRAMSEKAMGLVEFKNKNMNKNSLENFKLEAAALKLPLHMITAAESQMAKGVEKFEVEGQLFSDKGKLDLTVHMKKSGQSDYYYLNSFEVAKSTAKELAPDHKYLVTGPDEHGEVKTKQFDSAVRAMDFFKAQTSDYELAAGKFSDKDMPFRDVLATMKDGKVDYVAPEFRMAYYSPIIRNSHYVDRGKGFTVEQAANMLQGRAVFREDMVSRAGEQYAAWSQYQFDQPKDKYGNYTMKQFGEGYGFDLKKELASYDIVEMGTKDKAAKLVDELQNGNNPIVRVKGADGQEKDLRIEAVPRYMNLNFYELSGKPVKREELKVEVSLDNGLGQEKGKEKGKGKSQAQENELSL
ncbi:hypothetical protein [Pedobacter aquatilis]|uniref:hypothetical protein n=1 Tax=Pedobacter aquatilis TaxID=351343 RepID=UPI00292E1D36|nr:hypothetical protein [Pedobacter aquatilis]